MPKIIAIANQKGGVGKTTTVLNFAAGLKNKGKRVLVVDLDPQGNLTEYLGHEPDELPTISELLTAEANSGEIDLKSSIRTNSEHIDYIPSNIQLSSADFFLINVMSRERVLANVLSCEVFRDYEYILIDCLPSLGILLVNAIAACDSVLIPVQAQKFALDGIQPLLQGMNSIKKNVNPRIKVEGILITMMDNTVMCREVISALEQNYGQFLLNTRIRRSINAANSTAYKKSLVSLKGKLGQDYEALTEEILAKGAM